ncbi:LysR family transcriptional regulator [Photobacterium sp. 1_MG-2023]|uniref:LysR family transcriptional regulator n=1 Tax=Photobacterium sp. 1_MG-2023 TaxID=3062646 RepID=UPI0026E3B256|nr:LysR family transcriptional regulator [Photobacterium sp. 1_MG-2023]MDO6708629.1 LysR family transcriptional regulator [Photobacterium sp. 1_MG-2023]
MNSAALKVFKAVAEAGSVHQAAERLHCVPSNVTTRLKELEHSLGVALFSREKRRLQITAEGQILLEYAKQVFALLEAAEGALKSDTPAGPLHLVSMETTAAVRLPSLLTAFHQSFPAISLKLTTTTTQHALEMLRKGEADIGFVADNPHISSLGLMTYPLFHEELVLISPAELSFPLTASACRDMSMLVFKDGCNYRQRFQSWLETQRLGHLSIQEFGSFQAILGCVSAGMGLAMLPKSVITLDSAQSHIRLHAATSLPVTTQMVWSEQRAVSKTVRAFLDFSRHESESHLDKAAV